MLPNKLFKLLLFEPFCYIEPFKRLATFRTNFHCFYGLLRLSHSEKDWSLHLGWIFTPSHYSIEETWANCPIIKDSLSESVDKFQLTASSPFEDTEEDEIYSYLTLLDDYHMDEGMLIYPHSILRMRMEKGELP